MSHTFNIVAVSGSLQRPSRTLALVQAVLAELSSHLPVQARVIELGELAPHYGAITRPADLPSIVREAIQAVEQADLLIVASPVYRASYTGLFKHFFDFVHHEALFDVPVLLAATGGSERHALVIEHQLRPLFSFFQAQTLPLGIYAAESDFSDYQISASTLQARIRLAVERALPLISHRQPVAASTHAAVASPV